MRLLPSASLTGTSDDDVDDDEEDANSVNLVVRFSERFLRVAPHDASSAPDPGPSFATSSTGFSYPIHGHSAPFFDKET